MEVLSCSGQPVSFVWFMLLFMKTIDRLAFKYLVLRCLCTFHNEWSKWTWTSCLLPFPRERNRSRSLEYFYYLSAYLLIIHVLHKGILKACVNTKLLWMCTSLPSLLRRNRCYKNYAFMVKERIRNNYETFLCPTRLTPINYSLWLCISGVGLFIQSVILCSFLCMQILWLGIFWNITATAVFTVLGLV